MELTPVPHINGSRVPNEQKDDVGDPLPPSSDWLSAFGNITPDETKLLIEARAFKMESYNSVSIVARLIGPILAKGEPPENVLESLRFLMNKTWADCYWVDEPLLCPKIHTGNNCNF